MCIRDRSKGIPLAYEMARQTGQNKWFLARKGAKLYMRNVFSVEVKSITTAATQHLYLDGDDAEMMRGKRILIVDDVISTGESLHALEELVRKAGGEIVGRMAIPVSYTHLLSHCLCHGGPGRSVLQE